MVMESKEERLEQKQEAENRLITKGLLKKNQYLSKIDEAKTRNDSPNFKTKVKAWTYTDKQTHTYFHSLEIDVQVQDFTGTAELRCPYDSDLMEYWEPIRQTVVIYGTNRGKYKILFVGRVREVKQDGYELSITFQNYGWKFQQPASTTFVEDNVTNKDGYTIIRLILEALKIDSWVISPSAKKRLKEVGINEDGNLTLNGNEIEEIPDLIERLKEVDMSEITNENTIANKLKENKLANIKDINYTLQYEEPTESMQNLASNSNYTAGSNVYANAYGSSSGGGSGGSSSGGSAPSSVPDSQLNRQLCGGSDAYKDSELLDAIAYYNEYVNNRIAFNSSGYQKAYAKLTDVLSNNRGVNQTTLCKCLDNIRNNSAKPTATFQTCVNKENSRQKVTAHQCLTIHEYCACKTARPDASQACIDYGLNNHNTACKAYSYYCGKNCCG